MCEGIEKCFVEATPRLGQGAVTPTHNILNSLTPSYERALFQRVFEYGHPVLDGDFVILLLTAGTLNATDARLADAAMKRDKESVRSLLKQTSDVALLKTHHS